MINNINKNSYNMNSYTNIPKKNNNEIKKTQNNFQEIDKNLLKQIKEQIQKAELIAIKMIKGEGLTTNEKKFISEKYPDIKETAEQSIRESKNIKEQLKNFKTNEEKQQFLFKLISNIKSMGKKGALSEVQVKIKLSSIEEVEKLFQKEKLESKKAEIIAIKIAKGERVTSNERNFITEKYPEIKQISEQSIKEGKDLKEQLENLKTDEERQQLLSKTISDLEFMGKKGILSEIQIKFRMLSIERIKQEINKENELSFIINPYIYAILEYSSGNLVGIIIFIVGIIGFLYLI